MTWLGPFSPFISTVFWFQHSTTCWISDGKKHLWSKGCWQFHFLKIIVTLKGNRIQFLQAKIFSPCLQPLSSSTSLLHLVKRNTLYCRCWQASITYYVLGGGRNFLIERLTAFCRVRYDKEFNWIQCVCFLLKDSFYYAPSFKHKILNEQWKCWTQTQILQSFI